MSTVKISQLPFITEINANTEKTLMAGVDLPSGLTGKISMRTLAARLYSNDVLNVGINPIIYENVAAQFTDSSSVFIQTSLKNTDGLGSADYVAYANNSSGSNNFVDMGVNGPGFNDPIYSAMKPYDGYLFNYGPSSGDYRGNLIIGTSSANAHVKFIAGGTLEENIVGQYNHSLYEFYNPISVTGDIVNTGNVYTDSIIFGDGSIQEGSSTARLNASFLKANNALANTGNATFGYHLSVPDTLTANLLIVTGLQQFSGNALIRTATGTGNFKNITLLTGDEISTGNSGSIDIKTGSGGSVSGRGGDIILTPGTGATAKGEVYLNANVLVSNSIYFVEGGSYIDTNQLELNVGSLSNVNIHANVQDGQTPSTWTFGTDGTLDVPGNINFPNNNSYIEDSEQFFVATDISFGIQTNKTAGQNDWTFGTDGDLTVPGTIIFPDNTEIGYNPSASPAVFAISSANAIIIEANNKVFSFDSNGKLNVPGDLEVTSNTVLQKQLTINNSEFATNLALVNITASEGGATIAPSNTNYMIHVTGKANSSTRIVADAFGTGSYVLYSGRQARGTVTNPTATQNNDVILRFAGNGYTGSEFSSSSPAKIDFVASENYTDATRGSRIEFWNTPTGSNTIQKIASFNADAIEFTGTVNPQKGFIYNPTVLSGNQTAFTINYSTTSLIKATLIADLTISHSNFVAGRIVEVWLTNTSVNPRTVTHGISDLNSSTNATTFTIPATSSAYLKFFSIDGDLANTFVTVNYA